MLERMFRFYQRHRIVNINLNVIAGGLLAVGLTLIPVTLSRRFENLSNLHITLIAGVSDAIFDVLIYYALHWVANHWRPLRPKTRAEVAERRAKKPSFFRDATLVQFERALLSPVYYVVALGLKFTLLQRGMEREWALVVAFVSGIFVTRVLHTIWGLSTGRFRSTSRPRAAAEDDQQP